jgi:hypothetical protein
MHKKLKRKKTLHLLCLFAALGTLVRPSVFSYAEDLTTLDGKTFTNITEITKYPKQIFFTYNSNRMPVAISNLPEGFRVKHGIVIRTNAPIVAASSGQQQLSPIDLFLWQNRESKLEQREDEYTNSTIEKIGSSTKNKSKLWSITLQSAEVSLSLFTTISMFETENDKEVLKDTIRDTDEMSFDVGDADYISKVFDKFLEWENVAKTNNAVDFEKEINRRTPNKSWVIYHREMFGDAYSSEMVIYNFEWRDKHATLNVQQPDPYTGNFDRDDIINFQSLLKQLPSMKEKLVTAIRDKEAQKDLFK